MVRLPEIGTRWGRTDGARGTVVESWAGGIVIRLDRPSAVAPHGLTVGLFPPNWPGEWTPA